MHARVDDVQGADWLIRRVGWREEHEAREPHTVESLRSTLSGSPYVGVSRDFVDFGH